MRLLQSIAEMREVRRSLKTPLSLVPTMGNLHLGHLTLVDHAKTTGDSVITSIFVNPSQFAPTEDFNKYPRTIEDDIKLLEEKNVDFLFAPTDREMYPNRGDKLGMESIATKVVPQVDYDDVPKSVINEAHARPGFFTGVCTVVTKLLNIIQPERMHLGQKDGLQCILLRKLTRDLNMPTEVIVHPTIREDDGLAMSSRNRYLTEDNRQTAPILYQALTAVKEQKDAGVTDIESLERQAFEVLQSKLEKEQVEYLSFCDFDNGRELCSSEMLPEQTMVSAAIKFENCRILDNIII